jgi:hypothetical protein
VLLADEGWIVKRVAYLCCTSGLLALGFEAPKLLIYLVPQEGFEPPTPSLRMMGAPSFRQPKQPVLVCPPHRCIK